MCRCIHQASNSEAVESLMSLVPRSSNQREHDQASNSEAVESPASLMPRRQGSSTIIRVVDDINNNQRTHNGPADGFNQKVKIYHLSIVSYVTIKLIIAKHKC